MENFIFCAVINPCFKVDTGLLSKLKTKDKNPLLDIYYDGQKNSILKSLYFNVFLCDLFHESERKKYAK